VERLSVQSGGKGLLWGEDLSGVRRAIDVVIW